MKAKQLNAFNEFTGSAVLSICEKYRYFLGRNWDDSKPKVMFLMLNPSTADGTIDDPTIRRCINYAKAWGFGSLCVGNLFAYRSTDPKELLLIEDPVGWKNHDYLKLMSETSDMIVCAWGNSPIINKLSKKMGNKWKPLEGLKELHYIELSNDGTPKHPLYLKSELMPKKYEVVKNRIVI